jgi:hypothetical protein
MGRISTRLAKLEGAGRGSSCPGCGYPSNVTHDATFVDSYETYQEAYESGPEFCEVCKRRVLFPIFFTDDRTNTLPVMVCRMKPKEEHPDAH